MTQNLTKIYDILKTSAKYSGDRLGGEVGVEIETETLQAYDYPRLKYWNTEKDGSLRDWGVEYVLKAPLELPDLEKALEEFAQCEKKFKFKNSSVSTSVHVHLNFLNDTFLTMANFMTIYTLMENLLIRYSGPDRLSNLFCLPICDCEGVKDSLVSVLNAINRGVYKAAQLNSDRVKYGAINAAPLTRIGTLEVRSFRGETDIKVIRRWVDILMKMKTFARRDGLTPPQILQLWKTHREYLVDIVFQEFANELKVKDQTGKLLIENLKHASSLASTSRDWTKFGILKMKPVYKEMIKGDLDSIAQKHFSTAYDSLQYHDRILVVEIYQRIHSTTQIVDAVEDI